MPRATWALRHHRPCIEIVLTLAADGKPVRRHLLADTGAGSRRDRFQLILDEDDCLLCGGNPMGLVKLGGAFVGSFPTYMLPIQIPALGFNKTLRAVGLPSMLKGFDGIACFRFLNHFTYGNFGDPDHFGLES